jgi:hypothetical protein
MSTASGIPRSPGPATSEATGQGCAYVFGGTGPGAASAVFCDAPRRRGSAYCSRHHALCHLAPDSLAETRQLRAIEALAEAVGGRRSRPARQPPPRLLRRLDRIARAAVLRPDRSGNVHSEEAVDAASHQAND